MLCDGKPEMSPSPDFLCTLPSITTVFIIINVHQKCCYRKGLFIVDSFYTQVSCECTSAKTAGNFDIKNITNLTFHKQVYLQTSPPPLRVLIWYMSVHQRQFKRLEYYFWEWYLCSKHAWKSLRIFWSHFKISTENFFTGAKPSDIYKSDIYKFILCV